MAPLLGEALCGRSLQDSAVWGWEELDSADTHTQVCPHLAPARGLPLSEEPVSEQPVLAGTLSLAPDFV